MSELTLHVGVILARRRVDGPWPAESWRVVAVLPSPVALESGARIAAAEGEELVYAGACDLTFHRADTSAYRDNLQSGEPKLWVMTPAAHDPARAERVTADPYEGEALAETHGARLDTAPMPLSVQEELARFVEQHHVERPFIKRKRQ